MGLDRRPPQFLLHATRFQTHSAVFNPLWVVETLRAYEGEPHRLLDPITQAAAALDGRPARSAGRPRSGGRFELAYFAFVFSRHPDVRPWWSHAGHSIWKAAGFRERPSYSSCRRRFAELEHPAFAAAVEEVASTLIQLAVKGSEGRVGRYLHFDATEAETHARLEHVCPPESRCRRIRGGEARHITASATTPVVREHRHEEAVEPEPKNVADFGDEIGDAETISIRPDRLRITVGGCDYDALDPTAGVRAYTGKNGRTKRFWVGFYNTKAIDHFTGAPVAVRITSASVQEHRSYPDLYAAAVANTGGVHPAAVVADRGYSISSVFEHNTRLGVGSVMPWRAHASYPDRSSEDRDTHDRHGVVRCKHCGGPTDFVSFARTAGAKRGKDKRGPRLYVLCRAPITPACEKRQSIGCQVSWRMLLPLWRDTPTYLALRHSHDRYERVHHHWRVRWRSGIDEHGLRPKRRGRPNQQLRANAALLVEWLMICWRERWLPDSRPLGHPDPDRIIEEDGYSHTDSLDRARADLGLEAPYGPRAVALKVGPARPRRREAVSPDTPHDTKLVTAIDPPGKPPKTAAEITDRDLALDDEELPF